MKKLIPLALMVVSTAALATPHNNTANNYDNDYINNSTNITNSPTNTVSPYIAPRFTNNPEFKTTNIVLTKAEGGEANSKSKAISNSEGGKSRVDIVLKPKQRQNQTAEVNSENDSSAVNNGNNSDLASEINIEGDNVLHKSRTSSPGDVSVPGSMQFLRTNNGLSCN